MRKTSLYLSDREVAELKRLAAETGKSEASIVRDAIVEYGARYGAKKRTFKSAGIGKSTSGRRRTQEDLDRALRDEASRDSGWR